MHTRTLVALLIVGALSSSTVAVVSAHDSEVVDGYEVTFGGADEPGITDERMWLEVRIVEVETDEPVEGLEDSLTIALQRPFGNDTHELDLGSRFGEPGWYEAAVVFTEPGTYTVFINGSIEETEVNLRFQTQVHDASNLEYPPRPTATGESNGVLTEGRFGFLLGITVAALGLGVAFVAGRRY